MASVKAGVVATIEVLVRTPRICESMMAWLVPSDTPRSSAWRITRGTRATLEAEGDQSAV